MKRISPISPQIQFDETSYCSVQPCIRFDTYHHFRKIIQIRENTASLPAHFLLAAKQASIRFCGKDI
jgi:hypothetical protein